MLNVGVENLSINCLPVLIHNFFFISKIYYTKLLSLQEYFKSYRIIIFYFFGETVTTLLINKTAAAARYKICIFKALQRSS